MIGSFAMFEGTGYTVEKRNVPRDSVLGLAKGTLLLHSEVVINGSEEFLEVWVAVPVEEDVQPQAVVESYAALDIDEISTDLDIEDFEDE